MRRRWKFIITLLFVVALTTDIFVDRQRLWGGWIPGRVFLVAVELDYFRGRN